MGQTKQISVSLLCLQINPQHCIPTIIDGECTLWESRAIVQYLANKYDTAGTLYPIEPEQRARVDQKLFFDMTLFSKVREYYFAKWMNLPVQDPELMKALVKQVDFLEAALQDQQYAAGDEVTIADFSLVSTLTVMELGKFPIEDYANISKWLELCKETVPGMFTDDESKGILGEKIEEAMVVDEVCEAVPETEEGAETAAEEGE